MSTETNRKGQFGPLYKGHEGQYSWLLHRITGVAIILFLFAHVVDTAVVGWGPEAYNRVASVYHNPFVRLLELGLVAAVLYHSFNGVKIMLIDFFPGLDPAHPGPGDRHRPAVRRLDDPDHGDHGLGRSSSSSWRAELDGHDDRGSPRSATPAREAARRPAGTARSAASSSGPGSSCASPASSCCSSPSGTC